MPSGRLITATPHPVQPLVHILLPKETSDTPPPAVLNPVVWRPNAAESLRVVFFLKKPLATLATLWTSCAGNTWELVRHAEISDSTPSLQISIYILTKFQCRFLHSRIPEVTLLLLKNLLRGSRKSLPPCPLDGRRHPCSAPLWAGHLA